MTWPWKTKYKIIEIEKPRMDDSPLPQEAVTTLQAHPGFQYLLKRLRAQKSALANKLLYDIPKDLREVDILQAGIFWASWLERQLNWEVNKIQPRTLSVDSLAQETAAFDEILNNLELIK